MNKVKKTVSTGKYAFSLAGQRLYPYLKITAEKYPRVLVTRVIENDGAEYFGPFLPETGVRFRLRVLPKTIKDADSLETIHRLLDANQNGANE